MEENESFDPLKVRSLGSQAVMTNTNGVANLIEQTWVFHSASLHRY